MHLRVIIREGVTLWCSYMTGSVYNSPCRKRTTMGSWRGLIGDGEAIVHILLQETSQALSQPCHDKMPRKLSGVATPDCVNNRSSMRELDASSISAVNEFCDTSSWKVEMLLRTFFQMANLCYVVDMYPKQNPFQAASLNIASYTIL